MPLQECDCGLRLHVLTLLESHFSVLPPEVAVKLAVLAWVDLEVEVLFAEPVVALLADLEAVRGLSAEELALAGVA